MSVGHRVHVLICDGDEVFRAGLQAVVHSAPDLIVVGRATSCAQAVQLALELTPHVAVVSQDLVGGAFGAVATLSRAGVSVIVVGRTGVGLVEALRVGATGYLTDAVVPDQLVQAVRAAARGQTLLDPRAVVSLLLPAGRPAEPGRGVEPDPSAGLPDVPPSPEDSGDPEPERPTPALSGRPPLPHPDIWWRIKRRLGLPPGRRCPNNVRI